MILLELVLGFGIGLSLGLLGGLYESEIFSGEYWSNWIDCFSDWESDG